MSLATRCLSCQTAFRVVQDQLKVSEGWVRCGRCGAVFNALEELFDLGSEEAVRLAAAAAEPAPPAPVGDAAPQAADDEGPWFASTLPATLPGALSAAGDAGLDPEPRDDPATPDGDHADAADGTAPAGDGPTDTASALVDPEDARALGERRHLSFDQQLFRKKRGDDKTTPVRERDQLEFSDARFDSDLFADAQGDDAATTVLESRHTDAGELPLESSGFHAPDFMRRAERRARWKSRPMRVALATALAVGLVTLALQVLHHQRDVLAATQPWLRPLLAGWCGVAGCELQAPRQVDAVTVESTALTRAIGRDGYTLAVTLQSRARHAIATPWMDLALTDSNGRLIARKALAPRDFGAAGVLQPGRETALELALDAGTARVAGYTVEIFYP